MAATHHASLVLLHGAYHGPEIWQPLCRILSEAEVHTRTPDLRDDPEAALQEVLSHQGPLYLVAHSLAGAQLCDALAGGLGGGRVEGVAFLAAYIPREGENVSRLAKLDKGAGIAKALRVDKSAGKVALEPDEAASLLYNDLGAGETREWALSLLEPQAIAPFASNRRAYPRDANSGESLAYILCRKDRAITPALQRRMAADADCDPLIGMNCGHMPMVSCPKALARLLIGLWPTLTRPA